MIANATKLFSRAPHDNDRRAPPRIAARLLITDVTIALMVLAGAVFVGLYGLTNYRLLQEQVTLNATEVRLAQHREAAFETHVAATAVRERWNTSDRAEQQEMLDAVSAAVNRFKATGEDLAQDPSITGLPEFESGPSAIAQLSMLAMELADTNQAGQRFSARQNLGTEFNGNYRFLLGMLSDVEAIATRNTSANQQSIADETRDLVWVISAGALILILALGARFALMMHWVVRPSHALAEATTEFANGDTSQDIPPMPVEELERIANALAVFRDVTLEAQQLRERSHKAELDAQKAAIELEAKERETREMMDQERQMAIMEMAARFETSVSSVVRAASAAAQELDMSAEELANSVSEAGSQATQIAAASGQATNSVQSVAAAIEELSNYVRDISDQVEEQTRLSQAAQSNSKTSVSNAQVLSEKTASIDSIANVIAQIADQTNMLALNATIEAARAGSVGQGFTVVASEVKSLAHQSRRSATEIGGVLQTVNGDVSEAVSSISDVAASLAEIGSISQKITDAMTQHGSITSEISKHASEAAKGTERVNTKIADLANNTERANALSQNVKLAASELGDQARLLDQAAQEFIEVMRAG